MPTVAVLRGDGIGPEVIEQGLSVLRAAAVKYGLALSFEEALVGGAAYDVTGHPLPAETRELCLRADAVLSRRSRRSKDDATP